MNAVEPVRQTKAAVTWDGRNEGGLTGVHWFTQFVRVTGPVLGPLLLLIGTWFFVPVLHTRRQGAEIYFTHLAQRREPWWRRQYRTYRLFLSFTLGWFDRTLAFVSGLAGWRLDVIGQAHLDAALAAKKGVILLTAHVGNFELGAWLLEQAGRPVNVVMIDSEAEQVNRYLRRLRGLKQPKIIAVNQSPFSSLQVLAALRNNEIVCMQGDRAHTAAGLRVPFLGREAVFPTGPYMVAQMAQAPVIPVFVRRLGNKRYQFCMYPALPAGETMSGEPGERKKIGYGAAVHRYVQLVEREVLLRPYDWFNLYSFWA